MVRGLIRFVLKSGTCLICFVVGFVGCESGTFLVCFVADFVSCEKAESDLSRSLAIAPREKSDSAFLYVYEIMQQNLLLVYHYVKNKYV